MICRELIRRLSVIGLSGLILFARPSSAQITEPSTARPPTKWPDAATTGAPAGAVLARHDGDLTIDTPGAVVSDVDIRGAVHINAPNVTLKNCRVTVAHYVQVRIANRITGTTIQDCTIDGVGSGNDGSSGIQGTGTFLRNNIRNVENGITVDDSGNGTLIQDNYIHHLLASGSPHYDGVQIDGNISNVTIRHNTIINDHPQTSAVMIDNYFGPISNIAVEANILIGGGYTIYVDGQFDKGPITNVSINNNRMGKGHWGLTNFNRTSPTGGGNTTDGRARIQALTLSQ